MAGRLGVDFGTSNSVVAAWDEGEGEGVPIAVPDYGRQITYRDEGEAPERISIIPSLIHYVSERQRWIGNQVRERNLCDSPRTFQWMKWYIAQRNPTRVRVDDNQISHFEAGRDFLSTVLVFAAEQVGLGDEEVAFTLPVESFEHYQDWLAEVAETAGMERFRIIDEPSAAALGYGASIQPGDVYLIFDFGGGTMDVSVVMVEKEQSRAGRRCRVLGKAGEEIGGKTLDQWMFEEVLERSGRSDSDADVRAISRNLLMQCEQAKERLSFEENADVTAVNPETGAALSASFSREDFEDILDAHGMFTGINEAIRRALNESRERGYDEGEIRRVLLVGGSCMIPAVQQMLRRRFGNENVLMNRPLDAVARGAAAFVSGQVDFFDHIQHDYALRYFDSNAGDYGYEPLVEAGTKYPTGEADELPELTIKATHDGQRDFGIAIFEVSEGGKRSQDVELVYDPSGAPRLSTVSAHEQERRSYFWMNEDSPTFLHSEQPAELGERRFRVSFGIDGNKRLLITARDLRTGRLTHKDYPVVKLV